MDSSPKFLISNPAFVGVSACQHSFRKLHATFIVARTCAVFKGVGYGLLVWARIPSLKGSELRAPALEVVYNGVIMGLYGFQIRGPYWGTIGSTSDVFRN